MPAEAERPVARDRILMTVLGALAGFAAYLLVEYLPDRIDSERLLLFVVTATGGFFAALLAATGPLAYGRAAIAAAASAIPAAVLLTWASGRYTTLEDFLQTIHAPAAYALIVTISLPFLIAALRPDAGWRHYPTLFRETWNIVVRYAAAWLFTAVVWAVVALSDALFGLVGLTIIEDLIAKAPVPYLLTGAVLGLALAVVTELSDYVSPFLILRLMRLLLPVVLIVTAIFLAALPFRGLSNLFGGLSAAATLLAVAIAIATLITAALDRRDRDAAAALVLRASAQACAFAIPILAALALYSVWLRVRDYGLSPDRIAAACAAAVTLGYGVLYALAVIARRDWMGRIRRANVVMALVVVALAALWLTPVLNPERISAQNQVARFAAGKVPANRLDLWFIGKELGVAGDRALARLAAMDHPDAAALAERIDRLRTAESQYNFETAEEAVGGKELIARILGQALVLPTGAALPEAAFAELSPPALRARAAGCAKRTPAGRPGCIAVLADLSLGAPGREVMFFWLSASGRVDLDILPETGAPPDAPRAVFIGGSRTADLTPEALDALVEAGPQIGPASLSSLRIGGAEIVLVP